MGDRSAPAEEFEGTLVFVGSRKPVDPREPIRAFNIFWREKRLSNLSGLPRPSGINVRLVVELLSRSV